MKICDEKEIMLKETMMIRKKDTPRKIGWKKMGRKKEEKCVDDLTRPPQLCWRRHGWEAPAIQHQPFYDSYYYLNIWKDFYYNLNRWKGCFYHILHFYCILNNILKGMKEVQMDTEFEQKI